MPEPNGHHEDFTTLTLVRHGETDWNAQRRMQGRSDIPLNERGREQAELVAQRLEGTHWDGIVSSPLSRVMGVSRAIAKAIHFPEAEIIQRPDLVERGFGEAEGMTLAERTEKFGIDGVIPGIESYAELDERVMKALREIEARFHNRRVLVVAHGGVITGALEQLTHGELGHGKVFIANVSLTTVHVRDGVWEVDEINDYAHLLGTEYEPITAPVTGSGQASVRG
jgi:uncharacterized phosphatase